MAMRDNAQSFIEKLKKNRSAFIAAAVVYVVALLVVSGWVANIADKDLGLISSKTITMEQIKAMANIADKDLGLISSKTITMEQIKAMANMGYWLSKAWFWSLLAAAILVYILIKAAGEKKVSTGEAAFLTALSVVAVVFWRGWVVVSKAALFKSLLGNWASLALIIVVIWLSKKFWSKIKNFFAPPKVNEKNSEEEK